MHPRLAHKISAARVTSTTHNTKPVDKNAENSLIAEYSLKGVFAYLDNVTVAGMDKMDHDIKLKAPMEAAKEKGLTFNDSKSTIAVSRLAMLGYVVSHGQVEPDPDRLKPLLEMPDPQCLRELKRGVGMMAYYARWIPRFSELIHPLTECTTFPMSKEAILALYKLKKALADASLKSIDESLPFTVESDASDKAIAAILSQGGRPVAFMSRTLSKGETRWPSVEKEAAAIVEATRKWGHLLQGRKFTLVTDQKALTYIFDSHRKSKIKSTKLHLWRIELGQFEYDIIHKPGKENQAPDALSRAPLPCEIAASITSRMNLTEIHQVIGHPGVTRMHHFIKTKNLPYSLEEVRQVCGDCRSCTEIKPRYFKPEPATLIKATRPWERISIDFKGPLRSSTYPHMLVMVDEYSRFPFAFPCKNTSTGTVLTCLSSLFALFGLPSQVHSDRGSSFVSEEFKKYMLSKGVVTSTTTPYHPTGNSQCERMNQTIWRTVKLLLKNTGFSEEKWAEVLLDALHCVRSLLCTSINQTPHERFLQFPRKSMLGLSLPNWLLVPGPVMLRKFVTTKAGPKCEEVELLHTNPSFAQVRHKDGRETTVSLRDLAPCPDPLNSKRTEVAPDMVQGGMKHRKDPVDEDNKLLRGEEMKIERKIQQETETEEQSMPVQGTRIEESSGLRRSTRIRKPPKRFGEWDFTGMPEVSSDERKEE